VAPHCWHSDRPTGSRHTAAAERACRIAEPCGVHLPPLADVWTGGWGGTMIVIYRPRRSPEPAQPVEITAPRVVQHVPKRGCEPKPLAPDRRPMPA
jgi:hypothetical protein